jgi:hypothetical protein
MSVRLGFEHRKCAMFLALGHQDQELRRSGMFLSQQQTCRSYGAKNVGAGSYYKHDAPTALDLGR